MGRRKGLAVRVRSGLTIDERIDYYSIPVPECGCRIWTGDTSTGGYARLKVGGKDISIIRLVLERKVGPLPPGIMARHTCDIPCCIAEDHLVPGTDQDNKDDMVQRGRSNRGEKHPLVRLSIEDVIAIRASVGPQSEIGRQFGVSQTMVSAIKRRKKWGHLP